MSDSLRELLEQLLRAEVEIAAHVTGRDPARMTTADAVRALDDLGRAATQREPLVETDFALDDLMLQGILATLCARYGAGVHRKAAAPRHHRHRAAHVHRARAPCPSGDLAYPTPPRCGRHLPAATLAPQEVP